MSILLYIYYYTTILLLLLLVQLLLLLLLLRPSAGNYHVCVFHARPNVGVKVGKPWGQTRVAGSVRGN